MRTKIGEPDCIPFFAKSEMASFDNGTSEGGGIVGVLEQAASMTMPAMTTVWTATLHVSETRVSTKAPFPN